ncbi:hypothetical protein [Hydrogenivirga sp.]
MKALIGVLLTASILSSKAVDTELRPYSFKNYERYIYDYKEVFRGRRNSARFEVTIRRVKDSFEVRLEGRYREWEGMVSGRFSNAQEVAGFVLMKSYFEHHWLVPLSRTLFSQLLVKALEGRVIKLKPGVKRIDGNTFRIVRKCRAGGLEGMAIEIVKDKELLFRVCLSPYASLPVHVYRRANSGDVYELRLLEYSDIK